MDTVRILLMGIILTLPAFGDFFETKEVSNEQEATAILFEQVKGLNSDVILVTLQETNTPASLRIGRSGNGFIVYLLAAHFRIEGHGETIDDEIFLTQFPIKPNKGVVPERYINYSLNKIVPLLNRKAVKFKMVTYGMRRRDTEKLSWASSMLQITCRDLQELKVLLPSMVTTILTQSPDIKFMVSAERRKKTP